MSTPTPMMALIQILASLTILLLLVAVPAIICRHIGQLRGSGKPWWVVGLLLSYWGVLFVFCFVGKQSPVQQLFQPEKE